MFVQLARFDESVRDSYVELEPCHIVQHLFQVRKTFPIFFFLEKSNHLNSFQLSSLVSKALKRLPVLEEEETGKAA